MTSIRALAALLVFLIVGSAHAQLGSMGAGGLPINRDALLLASPYSNGSHSQIQCFYNANDVGDFYGTAAGTPSPAQYNTAVNFFSGSPPSDAKMCFVRLGVGGTRSRIIGATVCQVTGTGTACEAAGGATTSLAALKAITAGTLTYVQNGITVNLTGIDLSTATTLGGGAPSVVTLLNTVMQTYYPANTVTANITGAVTNTTCTGITGVVGFGFFTVTVAAGGNCIYPGGNMSGVVGQGTVMGQVSGTPNGVGTYIMSSNLAASTLVPQTVTAQTLTYNLLTIAGSGSTGTMSTGQSLGDGNVNLARNCCDVYAKLAAGVTTQPATCTGAACNSTTWIIGAAAAKSVTSEAMTVSLCQPTLSDNPYVGATQNTSRFWFEQVAECSSGDLNTLTYATSPGGDNLASLLGLAANSPGIVANSLSGPTLSAFSETLGSPNDPNVATYTAAMNTISGLAGVAQISNWELWWDPDDGQQTPTYKNEITTWFSTHAPYNYARVWVNNNAYAAANYTLNSPYGLPACVANTQIKTPPSTTAITGTLAADYCPVHDIVVIGAAGNAVAGAVGGSGFAGGGGASGGLTYVSGLTTNSGTVPIPYQVGAAGNGTGAGNDSSVTSAWSIFATGSFFGSSSANASGVTGGALGTAQTCGATLNAGTTASVACAAGKAGRSAPGATAGAGGEGGSSAPTLSAASFIAGGGAAQTTAGGGGGAGTNQNGVSSASNTGGNGGNYLDGTAGGAGGTANGTAPGGGGGGTTTISGATGNGANGRTDTQFATALTHCTGLSTYGSGGGGGGGGGYKAASGAGAGGNGGNAGGYGAAGGSGGGNAISGSAGQPGTSTSGLLVVCGYQDH